MPCNLPLVSEKVRSVSRGESLGGVAAFGAFGYPIDDIRLDIGGPYGAIESPYAGDIGICDACP